MHIDIPVAEPVLVGDLAGEAEGLPGHRRSHVGVVLVASHLVGFAGGGDRRVVHQDVHCAKTLNGVGEHLRHRTTRGDVAAQRQAGCARLFHFLPGLFQGRHVDVADDEIRAGLGEVQGDGAAQAAAGSGDQGNAARQLACCSVACCMHCCR
ncbi:hypothetical protein D9M71_673180 [compost metagenome]